MSMIPVEATVESYLAQVFPDKGKNFKAQVPNNTVNNLKNILTHITSPCLEDFCIDGFIKDRGDETMHGWKNEAFIGFLARHKTCLKKIILDGRGHGQGHYDLIAVKKLPENSFPVNLQRLELVLHGTHLEKNQWVQLIQNQKCLETLHFDIVCDNLYPIESLQTFLPLITTLKHLSVGWGCKILLDLRLFEIFENLIKLDLFYDTFEDEIQDGCNFESLRNLKKLQWLYLSNIFIPTREDLHHVLKIKSLDYLSLTLQDVDYEHLVEILWKRKLFSFNKEQVYTLGEDPDKDQPEVCPCCSINLDH